MPKIVCCLFQQHCCTFKWRVWTCQVIQNCIGEILTWIQITWDILAFQRSLKWHAKKWWMLNERISKFSKNFLLYSVPIMLVITLPKLCLIYFLNAIWYRIHPSENASLPSVIQSYLQGGKLCIECCKNTLRYKIIKGSVLPSSFNRGATACEISPALSSFFVKKIICPACDRKNRNSRVSKII